MNPNEQHELVFNDEEFQRPPRTFQKPQTQTTNPLLVGLIFIAIIVSLFFIGKNLGLGQRSGRTPIPQGQFTTQGFTQ